MTAERALHPVSDATPERSRLRTKPWLVRLTCCGRADGVYAADSWDEAQAFREAYTSGPGVSGGHVGDTGHDRSAVIEDALAASADATPACICGRAVPVAGTCFDIDGAYWSGHGEAVPATGLRWIGSGVSVSRQLAGEPVHATGNPALPSTG